MQSLFVCLWLLFPAADSPKKPNVVLVMIDDAGYGDFGCYGCKDTKTPNVDRLARQGTRLTHFYSAGPVCTPTRAALMTGRYQQRCGLEWALSASDKKPGLPSSETSIAKLLAEGGYRTALFGKWHLGFRKEYGPNAHGFGKFVGLLSGYVDHYSKKDRNGDLDWYEDTKAVQEKAYSTDAITARSVDFIREKSKAPFFVYVAYAAPHWPFQPPDKPKDLRDKSNWFAGDRKDYAAMIERIDDGVGKILAALDERKLADDTLVLFTNDNGGERLSDNGPLFHRKGTLWEGGIRVPCILRWPGRVAADKVSAQPGITMDLTATILATCAVEPAKDRPLDGIDLLAVLKAGKSVERTFCWRIDRDDRRQKAVRHGDWKYVKEGSSEEAIELLFDLAKDEGERKDVAASNAETVKLLREKLAAWEKEMGKHKPMHVVK